MKRSRTQTKRAGFTLVEIMVVVVILGLLVTLVTIKATGMLSRAERTKAMADLRTFSDALELYRAVHKRYPTNEEGLGVLTKKTEQYPEGILGSVPRDPWGHAYLYLYPGEHGAFDLKSLGRDGTEGGSGADADLGSWDLE